MYYPGGSIFARRFSFAIPRAEKFSLAVQLRDPPCGFTAVIFLNFFIFAETIT
jgi:hypothetical protein